MSFFDTWIPRLLLAIFVLAGASKFTARSKIDAERWGYSLNFLRLVGVVEIGAAIALFWDPYWAAATLLIVMAGALGTSYKHRNYKELVHPLVTTGLLLFVLLTNI
jgi:hypothetical protein